MKENFNVKGKKGSIAIFVLVGLLFMSAFLMLSYGYNVNKSKIAKEQFNSISDIYSHKDGDANAYERAYTVLRKKNKQIFTETVEDSSVLELEKTYEENLVNYRIYGKGGKKYQQVEYIESTGTQYIDTGVRENQVYMLDFVFKPTTLNSAYNSYLGGTLDDFTVGAFNSISKLYLRHRKNEISRSITISNENKNSFLLMDNKAIVNDVIYNCDTTNPVGTGTQNIFILTNASKSRIAKAQIYSLKLYGDDGIIRDFIPCYRKADNQIGVYDKVTKEFYINQGDGVFEKGDDVISEDIPDSSEKTVGNLITDTSNLNYGKYKISVQYSNIEGESITKDIYLDKPLEESEYIDFKLKKVVRNGGIEEIIDLPEILLYEDYTKIEVLTEVKPSKIEVEYVGYTLEYNGRVPIDYKEVEYIESTGTQYINTGLGENSSGEKLDVTVDFQLTEYINNTWIYGTMSLECGLVSGFYNGAGFRYSQTTDYLARTTAIGSGSTENLSIMLFSRNYNNNISEYRPAKVKIYSTTISVNGQLVRNFIPCYRKEDNTIGMYDTVEGKFYTNVGTGKFIAGPEVKIKNNIK